MQLLEDEPELTEKLGEVPVAVIEKGKVAGRAPALRRQRRPLGADPALPGPRPGRLAVGLPGGDQGRDLLPHLEESVPAEAAAAQLPQRGHLHDVGLETGPLPRRESRRGRRLHPLRDRRDQAAGRGPDRQGRALGRPRPRQGRRGARQLRARLRRRRQGDGARRGHDRPPHLRRLRLLRHARGLRPAGVGARGEGDLGGAEAARPGHPHARLAAALGRANTRRPAAASSTRWARTRSASASSSASTTPTPPSASTTSCSASSSTPSSPRSSRAASGSAGARRRSPRAATGRCRSASRCPACWSPATPPGWSTSPNSPASTTRCTPGCTRRKRSSSR